MYLVFVIGCNDETSL